MIGARVHSKVEIDSLSLSWTGHQILKGFKVIHSQYSLSTEEIQVQTPLLRLIFSYGRNLSFEIQNSAIETPYGQGTIGSFKGTVSQKNLTLNEPVTLIFQPEKKFNDSLVAKIHPLFAEGIQTKGPISLTVSDEGLSIPLKKGSIQDVQINHATLKLGQFECRTSKPLAFLIDLIKHQGLTGEKTMQVECSPLSFSLQNGILQWEQMDAVFAQAIHLCSWGKVDLVEESSDMQISIPAVTLEKALKVKLPTDYLLAVTLKGDLHNPTISAMDAIKKIGLLCLEKSDLLGIFNGWLDKSTQPEIGLAALQNSFSLRKR